MGAADSGNVGCARPASRGCRPGGEHEFSCPIAETKDFVRSRETFGNSRPGGHAKKRQIESPDSEAQNKAQFAMARIALLSPSPWRQLHRRHPSAVLWLIAAVQALAMLAIGAVLRALMS
jgi:hypothetical protein